MEIKTIDTLIREKAKATLAKEVHDAVNSVKRLNCEAPDMLALKVVARTKEDNYKGEETVRLNDDLFTRIEAALVDGLTAKRGNQAVAKFLEDTQAYSAQLNELQANQES